MRVSSPMVDVRLAFGRRSVSPFARTVVACSFLCSVLAPPKGALCCMGLAVRMDASVRDGSFVGRALHRMGGEFARRHSIAAANA